MKTTPVKFSLVTAVLLSIPAFQVPTFAQGSLTPPGAPAPTMKTLQQIEPRTPISSITFVISQPGSYYLTTNLTAVSGHGIIISANNVTLDLNGFVLTGVPGAGEGIFVSSVSSNIVVRNGTLRNWPGYGVRGEFASFCQIEDLQVLNNGNHGIAVGPNSRVARCSVGGSGGFGIALAVNSVVQSCVTTGNGSEGIHADTDCVISDCVSRRNVAGISVNQAGRVANCVASANTGIGIVVGDNCNVVDCIAEDNTTEGINIGTASQAKNCIARTNWFDGIHASADCVISGCVSRQNGEDGIEANSGSRVEHCIASFNSNIGITVQSRCAVADNTSNANRSDGIRFTTDCSIIRNHACYNSGFGGSDGIYSAGDRNHIESNNTVGNQARGINCTGANVVIRNTASSNPTANFVISGTGAGPVQNASTATSPVANISY